MTIHRGTDRTNTATTYRTRYEAGDSIRGIAFATGRSYGYVRNLLLEAGTTLRPKGALRRGGSVRSVAR
ncbi:helix-turn-helix domain-containing protein [Streptomyces sp. NRRL F-5123]|uniref:helix-turn-helix domain-containing protein n=1 Tax=Streptomyces sp. NRRL F-5123 TaxID=1463856 RepID=UPI0004E21DFC|nr:helix-turn-helix domain-containing protein [Streptomyces sp. NRRL F-5123]